MAGDLKNELLTDPGGRGYNGPGVVNPGPDPMTDQKVTDDLNTKYETRNRSSMSGDEVFLSIANRADWDGLTDSKKTHFLSLCARQSIDPFGAANVELVKSIFGDSSQTVTNLSAARVESITRAQKIEIRSPVRVGHVQAARS